MKYIAALTLLASVSALAQQPEGISSAGGVMFRPVISCSAEGIDSTFPSDVTRVDVVKEADWEGQIIWEIRSVTVVTYNVDGRVLQYYPAEEVELRESAPESIALFRYRPGSADDEQIGRIRFLPRGPWEAVIETRDPANVPELILSGCSRL